MRLLTADNERRQFSFSYYNYRFGFCSLSLFVVEINLRIETNFTGSESHFRNIGIFGVKYHFCFKFEFGIHICDPKTNLKSKCQLLSYRFAEIFELKK
jgi:hypothetical protein